MGMLFSQVRVSSEDNAIELMAGGISRNEDDLIGHRIFDEFIEGVHDESEISVHVEAFIFGDGETEKASDKDVTYLYSLYGISSIQRNYICYDK